jgi:molybdopterin converting factor small subunit
LEIKVELFGQLRKGRNKVIELQLQSGATVRDAVIQLGLDPEEIGMMVVNGIQSELTDPLPPGCRLALFPYISGG